MMRSSASRSATAPRSRGAPSRHQPELAGALQQQLADRQRAPRRGFGVGRAGVQRGFAAIAAAGMIVSLTVIVIVALLVGRLDSGSAAA